MKSHISIFIILSLVWQACGNDGEEPQDPNQGTTIIVDGDRQDLERFLSEPIGTEFNLLDAEIFEDRIEVTVSYGGGCEEHSFEIVQNEDTQTDGIDIIEIALVHDGNNDFCEALITETLTIDFTEIPGAESQLRDNKTLRIYNASNDERLVIYGGLPAFMESIGCTLLVTAEDVICGDSMFGNTWFNYATLNGGPVYFQVAQLEIPGTFNPELPEGEYVIGVELSTPFTPDPGTIICLAYPGPSIPVTLLCLEER